MKADDYLVRKHPHRFVQCAKCQEWHPLEYFQGVRKTELRYHCENAMGLVIKVPFVGGLDIPTVCSPAWNRRSAQARQLQLVLMKKL